MGKEEGEASASAPLPWDDATLLVTCRRQPSLPYAPHPHADAAAEFPAWFRVRAPWLQPLYYFSFHCNGLYRFPRIVDFGWEQEQRFVLVEHIAMFADAWNVQDHAALYRILDIHKHFLHRLLRGTHPCWPSAEDGMLSGLWFLYRHAHRWQSPAQQLDAACEEQGRDSVDCKPRYAVDAFCAAALLQKVD